jgi:hypothetical protein
MSGKQLDERIEIPSGAASAWRATGCQASASLAEAKRRRDGTRMGWGWQ